MLAVQANAGASVVGVLDDRTYLELALALILSFESIAEPKTPSPLDFGASFDNVLSIGFPSLDCDLVQTTSLTAYFRFLATLLG